MNAEGITTSVLASNIINAEKLSICTQSFWLTPPLMGIDAVSKSGY